LKLRIENIIENNKKLENALFLIFSQLEDKTKDEKIQHSLLIWFVISSVENFEKIICPLFKDKNQQIIILETFKSFKNKKKM